MTLPILEHPTFELTVPSTNEKVRYRPFLVKEEKILLLAQQAGSGSDMITAIKQIIKNCVVEGDVDVDNAPTFDVEYMFLMLRANSVSDVAKFKIYDEETEDPIDIELDLTKVQVEFSKEHNNLITIGDNVTVQMKYPTYSMVSKLSETSEDSPVDNLFGTIKDCIDKIMVGDEEVLQFQDYSESEVDKFIDSLSSENFKDLQTFFETMPVLKHKVKYKIGKKNKTKTLSGIADFFQSA